MRLMAVHAHPDDESSKGPATMAKYAAEGHRVRVVTCTGGERGDILNPRMERDPKIIANMNEVRKTEMAASARALGVEPAVEAAWDEQAFGEWDGLTFKEIHAQSPDALARLRNDATYPAPGGESRAELDERVSDALDRAVALGGVVVVVTHRIVIMSVLARLLGLDIEAGWRLAAAPASLTGIEVWRDGNAQIAFTNDTHHLR